MPSVLLSIPPGARHSDVPAHSSSASQARKSVGGWEQSVPDPVGSVSRGSLSPRGLLGVPSHVGAGPMAAPSPCAEPRQVVTQPPRQSGSFQVQMVFEMCNKEKKPHRDPAECRRDGKRQACSGSRAGCSELTPGCPGLIPPQDGHSPCHTL